MNRARVAVLFRELALEFEAPDEAVIADDRPSKTRRRGPRALPPPAEVSELDAARARAALRTAGFNVDERRKR